MVMIRQSDRRDIRNGIPAAGGEDIMQQRQHREPYRRTRVTSQPDKTAHDRAGAVRVNRSKDHRPEPVPTDG
ncbi:hypothetical protein ACGGAQ_30160 [Micromonospora sp. NPDC047557]|uniref:hypothetical protein n=1 Tax=Micromonospora sp. NPDC047557 TaxID=3364250 RepID=UPI00371794CD